MLLLPVLYATTIIAMVIIVLFTGLDAILRFFYSFLSPPPFTRARYNSRCSVIGRSLCYSNLIVYWFNWTLINRRLMINRLIARRTHVCVLIDMHDFVIVLVVVYLHRCHVLYSTSWSIYSTSWELRRWCTVCATAPRSAQRSCLVSFACSASLMNYDETFSAWLVVAVYCFLLSASSSWRHDEFDLSSSSRRR